jgi:cell division protein FtsQ
MWNNPRLLNGVAGFLTALGLMAFVAAGVHLMLRSPLFPLREVTIGGEMKQTVREDIERTMQSRVSGNFFAADLGTIRAALEQLPWVRRVEVRRAWPDRIEVALEEHVALARWGSAALVNTHGERFEAASAAALPLFSGPDGTEREVTRRYLRFAELVAPLGAGLERVTLTPRRSWQIRLASGLQIELGRDVAQAGTPETRLARFVAAHPATLARIARLHENVDLRYPNGFALRVPEFKG